MMDQNEQSHRGIDLIGEKMSLDEQWGYLESKIRDLDKVLQKITTRDLVDIRDEIVDSSFERKEALVVVREKEEELHRNILSSEDGSGYEEWRKANESLESLERRIIEESTHPEAPKVRRLEALREYRTYLMNKFDEVNSELMDRDLDEVDDAKDPE